MHKTLKTIPDFNQAFTLTFLAPSKQNPDRITPRLPLRLTLLIMPTIRPLDHVCSSPPHQGNGLACLQLVLIGELEAPALSCGQMIGQNTKPPQNEII